MTVTTHEAVDPASLIHMPTDQGLPQLVQNRRENLGEFTEAVATAFETSGGSGDSVVLALLALHPSLGGYLVQGEGEMNGEAVVDVLSGYFDDFDTASDGGDTDGVVSTGDLEAVAQDPDADPLMVAAALYLLENPALLGNLETVNQYDPGDNMSDGRISRDDVDMFIEMREHLETLAMNPDTLDTADGGEADGYISLNDLKAAAADTALPEALRAATQWFLDHEIQRRHLTPLDPDGFRYEGLIARAVDDQAFTGDPQAAHNFVLSLPIVDVGETGFPVGLVADESVRALANAALTATNGNLSAQHQVISHLPETSGAVRNILITAFYDKMAIEMDHILAGSAAGDPTIPGHPGANWMMAAPWASDGVRPAITGDISVYGLSPNMLGPTDRQATADGNQWIFADIGARYATFIELHSGIHPPTTDQLQTFFDNNFTDGDADIRNAFIAMNSVLETDDHLTRQTLLFQANALIALHEQAGAQPWLEEISTGPDDIVVEYIDLKFGEMTDEVNHDIEPRYVENNLIIDQNILALDIDELDATNLAAPGGTRYTHPDSQSAAGSIVLDELTGIEYFAGDFPRTFRDWHSNGGETPLVVPNPYRPQIYDMASDPNTFDGSGANSWPDPHERMWHILKLFEATHTDHTIWETHRIEAGFDDGRFDWLHDETGLT